MVFSVRYTTLFLIFLPRHCYIVYKLIRIVNYHTRVASFVFYSVIIAYFCTFIAVCEVCKLMYWFSNVRIFTPAVTKSDFFCVTSRSSSLENFPKVLPCRFLLWVCIGAASVHCFCWNDISSRSCGVRYLISHPISKNFVVKFSDFSMISP